MYTLYYSPGACSMAVHVALNEVNAPFKMQNVAQLEGKTQAPEFLAVNPLGCVPVLQEGNMTLREGAAILIHLLEKHKRLGANCKE